MKNIPLNSEIDSEKKFWTWLRPKLNGHAIRIENSIGQGLPDVNVCDGGKEFWIELKFGHGDILIRPHQYAWGMRRAANGGSVFIFSYCHKCDKIAIIRYPFPVVTSGKYVRVADDAKCVVVPRAGLINIETVLE